MKELTIVVISYVLLILQLAVSVLCVVEAVVVYVVVRVVMAAAQSMSGLLATVAVKVTVATVMVIPTVFIRYLSAVLPRTVMCRGTRKLARRLLLALTAVDLEPNDRL